MLWKRHLSVYSQTTTKQNKQGKKDHFLKQTGSLAPIQTPSPIIYETLQPGIGKFLIRKKSKSIKQNKQTSSNTFFLHKGNNSQLIKEVLQGCGFSEVIAKEHASLIWYQSQQPIRKDSLKRQLGGIQKNYFINHIQITDKQKLFENLVKYDPNCVGVFVPKTYVIDFRQGLGKVQSSLNQFLVDYFKKNKFLKIPKKSHSFSFCNFYGQVCITFNKIFRQINQKRQTICTEKDQYYTEPMWIVKPTFLNRGKGIQVITNLKQLQKLFSEDNHQISIRMYQPEEKGTCSNYVIQQYIPNPLLYEGFKFDLRMWMLIRKNKKSHIQVYLYKDGYARIAAHKYATAKKIKRQSKKEDTEQKFDETDNYAQKLSKSIQIYRNNKSPRHKKNKQQNNDRYIHLTNNAVQKNCKEYGLLHQGNQIPLKMLIKNLNIQGLTQQYLHKQFVSIVKSIYEASKEKLCAKSNEGTFQLFGLDFLLDTNLKTWLIQVNCNPSLQENSTFLKSMLREMLLDMLDKAKVFKKEAPKMQKMAKTDQIDEIKEQNEKESKWIKVI